VGGAPLTMIGTQLRITVLMLAFGEG